MLSRTMDQFTSRQMKSKTNLSFFFFTRNCLDCTFFIYPFPHHQILLISLYQSCILHCIMTVSSKSILGNYLKVFKKPSHQYFARFEGSEGELVVWIMENVAKVCVLEFIRNTQNKVSKLMKVI